MVNELKTAFNEIAEMRALPADVVLEALQSALVSAYRRDSGASSAQMIEARIDPDTGRARIFVEKEVTEEIISPDTEVTLEKARFYNPEAQIGDTVMVQVEHTTKKFGRIAAQTAKQVILQKIREAERNALYDEFINREGDLMSGTVQNISPKGVSLTIGRAEVFLPRKEQIPGERYSQHQKLRVLIVEVRKTNKGPQITCSRSHRNMLRRLLEYEVPEIYNGQVEIKSIAREAGYRSKVAVSALQEGIDPVGACVGMRGIRIQNIVKELQDEKIDVIEWNPDHEAFISKALSPARVTGVYLEEDDTFARTAVVVVPDDQLSLAIGREGQNARLAAKLTGWRIDIKSVTETVLEALEAIEEAPLSDLILTHPALIADANAIVAKRAEGRTIMPEEFALLNKFADLVERRLLVDRQQARSVERAHIEAVKATLPPELFQLPLYALPLSEQVLHALEPLGSVGGAVLSTLVDDTQLQNLLRDQPEDALHELQVALDNLMTSDIDLGELVASFIAEQEQAQPTPEPVSSVAVVDALATRKRTAQTEDTTPEPIAQTQPDDLPTPVAEAEETIALEQETAPVVEPIAEPITDEVYDGHLVDEATEEPAEEMTVEIDDINYEDYMVHYDQFDKFDDAQPDEQKPAKKQRRQRRQLILDEDTGEIVAKRRRNSDTVPDDWELDE